MAETDRLTQVALAKRGFIRSYGLFWNANEVDWGGQRGNGTSKRLLGRLNKNKGSLKVADFWDQKGIYVLYNHYGPYYVGKTAQLTLGQRLAAHNSTASHHHRRWERFSWFGFRAVLKAKDAQGVNTLGRMPTVLLTNNEDTIADIEALLMMALGTIGAGNSRAESFGVAQRWEQIEAHQSHYYLDKLT